MFLRGSKTGVFTLVCIPARQYFWLTRWMFSCPAALRRGIERDHMESNEHLRDKHININETRELVYWSSMLQCDQQDIIHAVLKIGTSAKMVDDFLILNRRKNPKSE